MDPEALPRLKVIVAGLEAWLAGQPGQGQAAEVARALGEPGQYKEQRWLVRCLHTILSRHAVGKGY